MKFNCTLNEAGAGLVTTADFWSNNGRQLVRFNNKIYPLKDFIIKSKKDEEIQSVIEAIKKNKYYKGSVGNFILNLLKDKDGIIDIMIRNNCTVFDQNEIKRNLNKE